MAERKPKPKHVQTVCDVCGLDWGRHGKAPTTDKCIELLKADLASEKVRRTYPVPLQPAPFPTRPIPWIPQWTSASGASAGSSSAVVSGSSILGASGIPLNPATPVGKIEKPH